VDRSFGARADVKAPGEAVRAEIQSFLKVRALAWLAADGKSSIESRLAVSKRKPAEHRDLSATP
jgi:hypothetical protein